MSAATSSPHGDEAGLRSPLCDAVMLAVAERLRAAEVPVLLAVFGAGCDAELTGDEVLGRGRRGRCGRRAAGSARDDPGGRRTWCEEAVAAVPTEASAMALRAFRGGVGPVAIRGGERRFELSLIAAVTFFLDVGVSYRVAGRLAQALAGADVARGGQRRPQRARRTDRARPRASRPLGVLTPSVCDASAGRMEPWSLTTRRRPRSTPNRRAPSHPPPRRRSSEPEAGTGTASRTNMLPGRERRRFGFERLLVRLIATCGIVGIGVLLGAILVSQKVAGWTTGLVVAVVTVVLSGLLWSSRQL